MSPAAAPQLRHPLTAGLRLALWLAVGLPLAAGCGGSSEPPAAFDEGAWRAGVEAWSAERLEALTAEQGWLSLVDLAWLEPGVNPAGSAPDARVHLPGPPAPAELGSFELVPDADGSPGIVFRPAVEGVEARTGEAVQPLAAGEALTLASDAGGAPTVLAYDRLRFYVIARGDLLGVRVKDPEAPARQGFAGIGRYPVDAAWRVAARLERPDPPRTVRVPNVLGTIDEEPSPGRAVFRHDGERYALDAIGETGDGELFFVFGDATNGRGTYGGGRFLYAGPPAEDGSLVLDFNRAYNPPCAFSEFATCPLPPPGNDLPLVIAAGERAYAHGSGGHTR